MIKRDKVYYLGVALSLMALCCSKPFLSATLLSIGFIMVLKGYVK